MQRGREADRRDSPGNLWLPGEAVVSAFVSRTVTLRAWQRDALASFTRRQNRDFLAVACPGAGKTTFALAACRAELRGERLPIVVVVPTAHLKRQWAEAAVRFGLHLEPDWTARDGRLPPDLHGVVVTYAQVASSAAVLSSLSRDGFVILDEIHHAATDRSWGDGVQTAFEHAQTRLLLSGTPFRSDDNPIPFVVYTMGDHGDALSDYEYGYGEALLDGGVVRPVFFPRFDGHMEWVGHDGALREATFTDDLGRDEWSARLRTALSLEGEWLPTVVARAHQQLLSIRWEHPDAGGLVIATDHEHARGIADVIRRRHGVEPVIALSDDPSASDRIAAFARSDDPWIVAVRMVSEGVDIPRLRVGVFATTTTTAMFFRQSVGRIARWVPAGPSSQKSYLFVPDEPRLRHLAATIAEQRRHAVAKRSEQQRTEAADREWDRPAGPTDEEQLSLFAVLSSTALDPAEEEALAAGLDPNEDLLVSTGDLEGFAVELPPPPPLPGLRPDPRAALGEMRGRFADRRALRQRNTDRVVAITRTTGLDHAAVNAELNRRSGVNAVGEATVAQLEKRLGTAEAWLAEINGKA